MTRTQRNVAAIVTASALSLAALVALAQKASAADDEPVTGIPDPSIATLLPGNGDIGGIRKALAQRGVTYGANYTGDVNGNVSGGIQQGTHYIGLLELYSDIDLQKAMGLHGLSFHISGYQIHGSSISGENIRLFPELTFIFDPASGARLG